jgi:hypothetical protein
MTPHKERRGQKDLVGRPLVPFFTEEGDLNDTLTVPMCVLFLRYLLMLYAVTLPLTG